MPALLSILGQARKHTPMPPSPTTLLSEAPSPSVNYVICDNLRRSHSEVYLVNQVLNLLGHHSAWDPRLLARELYLPVEGVPPRPNVLWQLGAIRC